MASRLRDTIFKGPLPISRFPHRLANFQELISARSICHKKEIVDIDIKPGSYPNCFNINGNGIIPVAILGSENLDVANIDIQTLQFNGMKVQVRGKKGKTLCHFEDVSGDFTKPEGLPNGYIDLVCQFEDDPELWVVGVTEAKVTGSFFDGTPIEGRDLICIIP